MFMMPGWAQPVTIVSPLSVEEHYHRTLERTFECLNAEQKNQLEETLGILTAHLEEIKSDPAFALSLDESCMK